MSGTREHCGANPGVHGVDDRQRVGYYLVLPTFLTRWSDMSASDEL